VFGNLNYAVDNDTKTLLSCACSRKKTGNALSVSKPTRESICPGLLYPESDIWCPYLTFFHFPEEERISLKISNIIRP